MAPKKSSRAGEDERCPTLKLIMEKGPLSGQTIGFTAGTRVQIGRIVKGNSLAIKDAGISSRHLLIQFEPVPDLACRHWTVTDLGSSNGTILSGAQLEPSKPTVLSEGDIIKIGESASFKVEFEGKENESDAGNVRRNSSRRVRNQVGKLRAFSEDSELRSEKCVDFGDEGLKLGTVDEEKITGKKTQKSVAKELDEVELKMENRGLRRTRSSKKEQNLEIPTMKPDETKKSDNVGEAEAKQGRNARVTRSSRNNVNLPEDLNIHGGKDLRPIRDLELIGVKEQTKVSPRRTRSSRKVEDMSEIRVDAVVPDGMRSRKGTGGRKKLTKGMALEEKQNEESNLENKTCKEEESKSEAGVDELVEGGEIVGREGEEKSNSEPGVDEPAEEGEKSEREDAAGLASTSGVKEGMPEGESGKMVADLEKMTLGEWLAFLEVYLPKQIIDATEEMISDMKQKAARVHEFLLQQKNDKKGEVKCL